MPRGSWPEWRPVARVLCGLSMAALAGGGARLAALEAMASEPSPAPSVAPAPSAAIEGKSLSAEPASRERADEIASYALRVELEPSTHMVRGEGTITWRNASRAPVRELFVHLYLNAFKNERTAFMREPAAGFRGARLRDWGWVDVRRFEARELGADLWPPGLPTSPGDPEDETDIAVPLPRPLEPGETLTIDVEFVAKLPSITLRTGHHGAFHMVAQFFPKLAKLEPDGRWAHFPAHRLSEYYADFGAYDVTTSVPEGFEVGATGVLTSERREEGRVVRRFVQRSVHDFAFAAWDQFEELRELTDEGVTLRCLYPPGQHRAARLQVDAARFGLSHYGARYGRYPYDTLTIVHPPAGAEEAGGMEYPTLITTGGAWYTPAIGPRLLEALTLHELAHQWFYGIIATNEHAHPFLDEGLTSYAEVEAMRARHGSASAGRILGVELALESFYRASALSAGHDDKVAQPAPAFESGHDYGALVYSRALTLLETIGRVYGREALERALGTYARRHRFGHPVPEDLLAAVREAVGKEAAEALRVGIHERGWIDVAVDEVASQLESAPEGVFGDPEAPRPSPPAAHPGRYRGHALVRRRGTLSLPVDVDLVAEDGSVERVVWGAGETSARIAYAGATPLVHVVVDPEAKILIDEVLGNNARRAAGPRFAWGVLGRAAFAAHAAFAVVAP